MIPDRTYRHDCGWSGNGGQLFMPMLGEQTEDLVASPKPKTVIVGICPKCAKPVRGEHEEVPA